MNRNTGIGIAVVALAVIAGAVYFFGTSIFGGGDQSSDVLSVASEQTDAVILETEQFSILASAHTGSVGNNQYNSNPPTSGPHLAQAPRYGNYSDELLDEQGLHVLEHGGVWITYQPDLDADSIETLGKIARFYPGAIVLSPRTANESPIVVASWGRLMSLETVDVEKIGTYIVTYINNSPEPFASLN